MDNKKGTVEISIEEFDSLRKKEDKLNSMIKGEGWYVVDSRYVLNESDPRGYWIDSEFSSRMLVPTSEKDVILELEAQNANLLNKYKQLDSSYEKLKFKIYTIIRYGHGSIDEPDRNIKIIKNEANDMFDENTKLREGLAVLEKTTLVLVIVLLITLIALFQ